MYEKRKIVEEVIPIVNALKGFKTYFGGDNRERRPTKISGKKLAEELLKWMREHKNLDHWIVPPFGLGTDLVILNVTLQIWGLEKIQRYNKV